MKQLNQPQRSSFPFTDGAIHGSGNKEKSSAYQHEKIDPCSFSSSLYYGGQDICTNAPTSHSPGYNVGNLSSLLFISFILRILLTFVV